MQFKHAVLDAIAAGTVTLAFRRWAKPMATPGSRLRTAKGVVAIDAVAATAEAEVTDADAARAGFASRMTLLADLRAGEGRTLYRVTLRFAGPDDRAALREDENLDETALTALVARLARLDAVSRRGPWTRATLGLIAEQPGVAAAELCKALGREKIAFKADVRKLKEHGLTESLDVGYRLSARGRALIERLEASQRG